VRLLSALLSCLAMIIGVIWALQGAGVLGGSIMTGHPQWLYIGIGLAIVGLGVLWWSLTRHRADGLKPAHRSTRARGIVCQPGGGNL
jgi:hypothetical protein